MYKYWFDSEGNAHKIEEMETSYISNCLRQLGKMLDSWRGIIPEQLSNEELKQKDKVGMKAWFVFNGISYIDAFNKELENRSRAAAL